jgi:hypothetical protein
VVRAYADKEAMEVLFELVLPADDGWSPASVRALAEVKGVASFSRDLGMLVPISVSREGETAPTVHTFRAAFDTEGRDGVFRSVVVVTVYGVNPSPPAGINVAEEGSVNLPGPIKTRGAR